MMNALPPQMKPPAHFSFLRLLSARRLVGHEQESLPVTKTRFGSQPIKDLGTATLQRKAQPASRSAGLAPDDSPLHTTDGLAEVSVTLTSASQTQQLKCRAVCLCALREAVQ